MILSAFLFAGVCVTQEVVAQEQEIIVHEEQVPKEILDFVSKHFSGKEISSFTPKEKLTNVRYFVSLSDATSLEFDEKYRIIEISSKEEVPESLILPVVRDYLKEYYPKNSVIEWKLNRRSENHKFKLDEGTVLTFDKDGNFIFVYS